jgi:hypothetical protein
MRYYSSTASEKTLSSAVNTSDTTITLDNLTGLPASYPYTLVLDPDTASEEIVLVTSLSSGTTLNVTRGTDTFQGVTGGNGTAKQNHNSGGKVKHMITARDLQEPQNHIDASSAVHGLSGSVVGTSDAQTLTNKTISSSNNTISISSSAISDWTAQFATKANIASPALTGTPTAPTAADGTNTTQIATTAFVQTAANTKVAEPASNGIVVRTGDNSSAARSIVAGSGISVTNGDGVSGNITIAATTSGGSGTVTSITAGTGLTGGTITTSGTIAIDSTVVTTSGSQTLTNKTLTSPSVSGLYLSDSSIVFEGSSADSSETTLTVTNPTADRTITLPNATGTVVLGTSAMTLTNGTVDVSISSGSGIVTVSNANIGTSSKILVSIVDNDANGQYIVNAEALSSGSFDVYVKHVSSGIISGVTITVHWLAIG